MFFIIELSESIYDYEFLYLLHRSSVNRIGRYKGTYNFENV